MKTPAQRERPLRVYWLVGLGILTFSLSPLLVRFASEAPGQAVAVWRTVLAALLLAPVAFFSPARSEMGRFQTKDWGLIVAAGVLLGLHFVAWILSLYHTSVASASVLFSTSPLFMALFGYLLLKERLRRPVVLGIVLATAGAALMAWGDALDSPLPNALFGNGLALTGALLQCFYLLIGRVVRQKVSWLAYVFPLYTVTALTTVAVAWVEGIPLFGYAPKIYLLCLLMAVGPQILGHGSFNYGVKYVPAALLGLLGLLEPVVASIFAYFLFAEQPAPLAFAGMLLVLFAVALALYRKRSAHP